MTFVAGDVRHLMRAPPPVQGDLLLVALQADLAFLLRGDRFKGNGSGLFFVKIRLRGVGARRPVAVLAGLNQRFPQCLFEIERVFGAGEGFDVVFVAVKTALYRAG